MLDRSAIELPTPTFFEERCECVLMSRENIFSGTEWEANVGYARAVRADGLVHVSGTTATDESGAIIGIGDPYRQTTQAIDNIATALSEAGTKLDDVVRTRMYVTDIDDSEEVGRAHREAFGEIRPATSMIQVAALIDPEMLVEIEATAQRQE